MGNCGRIQAAGARALELAVIPAVGLILRPMHSAGHARPLARKRYPTKSGYCLPPHDVALRAVDRARPGHGHAHGNEPSLELFAPTTGIGRRVGPNAAD